MVLGKGGCLQKTVIAWACFLCVVLFVVNYSLTSGSAATVSAAAAKNDHVDTNPPAPSRETAPALRRQAQATPTAIVSAPAEEVMSSVRTGDGVGHTEDEETWNNAPRPPPRQGDFEVKSTAPDVFPGVDRDHLHGLLGLLPDGTERVKPTPLPAGGLSQAERRDAHRGFCFNHRVSDSLSLNRLQPDARSRACRQKHETYPHDQLPSASVVIVFHNEAFSILLRSVHSVLNHSPPRLLKEIILVDDASKPDAERFYERHWKRLQEELTEHCMALPKTTLVRLRERRGLMVARMEGVWRAKADVAVFLDSHIEATTGWLEPLLARIHEDRGHVVVPSIDSIGNEDFNYHAHGGGLGVLGFSWTLGQQPTHSDNGRDGTFPAKSPVMAGGLFASDRLMFLKLGGYDPEMRLYGGEEMEIGFRTWMCGGDIEYVPCSHVGHVFRTPEYWQGQVYRVPGEEIARNKLRTAEVWMDDYKQLVQYATAPLPDSLPIGDMEPRRALRRKLSCKNFEWYLKHVTPSMFVPKLGANSKGGALKNPALNGCIDTMGKSFEGDELGVYPCHGQHGTQAVVLDEHGLLRLPEGMYKKCVHSKGGKGIIRACEAVANGVARWRHDPTSGQLAVLGGKECLAAIRMQSPGSPFSLRVSPCDPGGLDVSQRWVWM